MILEFSEQEKQFEAEVRAFLDTDLTAELRQAARATPTVFAEPEIGLRWQRILHDKGWAGYNWPARFGGTGWDPVRRYIFEKQCALAGAPDLPAMGLKLLGPVLQKFGSDRQQRELLPRILSAEDYWCQGFSEPGSGSDLASLKTVAVRDGDHYVVNGSKLWTTHAQFADHMFCLARTDRDVKPQAGITFLLLDMRSTGVEVSPIIGMAGDHEVNAVFMDNVVVPATDRVGGEGEGWKIAKYLLENERGGSCLAPRLLADIAELRELASRKDASGAKLIDQSMFAARLAHVEIEALALEVTELRNLAEIADGKGPGPQSSLVKLCASTLRQQVDALTMSAHGYAGLQLCTKRPLYATDCNEPIGSKAAQVAPARYLNSRAWTIFGGTNEIQRTIIAKTVLGL